MKIKNVNVFGLSDSIIKSGYPMTKGTPENIDNRKEKSKKHLQRSMKLGSVPSGTGHDNFLKGIIVQFDIQYPEYFSPQLQRYNWIDIVSSQSKMHTLMKKPLTTDDFTDFVDIQNIENINFYIKKYKETNIKSNKKKYFNYVLSNLPSGYLKWMGISTNYLQLKTIYFQRKDHKLKEWNYFCNFVKELPLFNELVIKNKNKP